MIAAVITLLLPGSASAAATAVPLGTAGSFGVLAGAGITNTGATTINGDIGTFPTTTITGTATMTVNGVNHGGDAVTQGAKGDLEAAYNDAAGQGPKNPIAGNLGGQNLVAGVYSSSSSIGLTGVLTLNAAGNPDAVFVFQAGSSLITASGSSVSLINGAQACNVFWQIGSSATLGTNSSFVGTVLALADITMTTNATIAGRVLAREGAVTLDTNTISRPSCAAAGALPTSASPTPSASPALTPTGTPTAAPATTPTGTGTPAPTDSSSGSPTGTPAPAPAPAPAEAPAPAPAPAEAPAPAPAPALLAAPTSPQGPATAPMTTAAATAAATDAAIPGEETALVLGVRAGALGVGSSIGQVTGQVIDVPAGGVSAGGGPGSPTRRANNGAAGALSIGFLAIAVAAARRRSAR